MAWIHHPSWKSRARSQRIAAVGGEFGTVRVTVAKMMRGRVGKRFKSYLLLWEFEFGKNHGSCTERQHVLHAVPLVVAELTPFFPSPSLSLLSFPFPFRSSPGSLAPHGAGRATKLGKRASSHALANSFEGSAMGGRHALRVARRSRLKRGRGQNLCGCDHTSVNAPDPIKTPQLSALGLE